MDLEIILCLKEENIKIFFYKKISIVIHEKWIDIVYYFLSGESRCIIKKIIPLVFRALYVAVTL